MAKEFDPSRMTADQIERYSRAESLKSRTPEQQRNIQRRQAENNSYYNDPKARTQRANAERDAARKSVPKTPKPR
jgi:hypothetical protein